jgi:SAM-dependent methyltransferase
LEQQIYSQMAAIQGEHWWFVARRRILAAVLHRHVRLPDGARLLEAGCGMGGNLPMLADFGQVSAFEPDTGARQIVSRESGLEILDGRLPDAVPFEAESFDLVVALDVLEHVDDDLASLHALRRKLRPGGWVVITVPAFSFLWSTHDEIHHHKRRYRKEDLLRLVSAADLAPVKATYFNTLLFPAIALVRLAKNLLRNDKPDGAALPSNPINRLLTALFASERHLVGRIALPVGVSILMLARRAEA